MNKKILITGCNGFVAGYLIQELLIENDVIYGIDYQEESRYENVHYSNINLMEKDKFKSYIEENCISEIYHLAAVANTKSSHDDPFNAIETNIIGTVVLYEICRILPKVRLLVVGSSEMYNIFAENGVLREDCPLSSHSIYGVSKISAELIGQEYIRQYGVNIIFTRSFNHTGPGQTASYVLSDWAKQCAEIALNKKPAEIKVGNTDVSRDFLDVRDVVKAYVLLLRNGICGDVYNICSGNSYKLKVLLSKLVEMTGRSDIKIQYDDKRLRKTEPLVIKGSNEKLKRSINWDCEIKIEQTLKDLFDYWMKELSS